MTETVGEAGTMRIVTISREYGSGGGEIAARLARRLGWQLVDHEIVAAVARSLGVSERDAEAHDEHVTGVIGQILSSMRLLGPMGYGETPEGSEGEERHYRTALEQVVRATVAAGQSVIVGRGAQVLLGGRGDTLHARIVAPPDWRVAYVAQREGLDPAAARARIRAKDHDRARYLQAEYHRRPDEAHLYDLTLNTGALDLDDAVDLLALALERKSRLLALGTEGRPQAADVTPYPGRAGDLRPPVAATEDDNRAG